ncbi:MAG: phosphate/phosphite/phosphonate ABC transporter substrate-binding protein [Deltaproteobacteria bacterium]|nr:phosphate/phosphite/phosphonate ABC transporter substrate-binding protein [Deltaproteobacteria bacterium]
MKRAFSPQSIYRNFLLLIAGVLLVFLAACSRDADYKQVDFSKKTEALRTEGVNSGRQTLRVAVAAMISPKETFIYYRELIDYIGVKLDRDVVLVQRKTYGEVNDLLSRKHIDLAFICTGPYVTGNEKFGFEAIATPVIRGQPVYQSYLIVHRDSPFQTLEDLKGRDFAFTDPDSNTGATVPRYWLKQMGAKPESFFRTITYTYSHDNAIMAVAKKLVDGAAVDGHLWEYYQLRNTFYSDKTRVIKKSEPFGSPPLVVSNALDPGLKSALVHIVLTMHEDPEGLRILSGLMIDRFETPRAAWYAPVKTMMDRLSQDDAKGGDGSNKP